MAYPRDNEMLAVLRRLFEAHGVTISGPKGYKVGEDVIEACKDCAVIYPVRGFRFMSATPLVPFYRAAMFAHCGMIDYDELIFKGLLRSDAVAGSRLRGISLVQRGELGIASRVVMLTLSAKEKAALPPITEYIMHTRNDSICDSVKFWGLPAKYIVTGHGANLVNMMMIGPSAKCVIEVFPPGYYTPCYLYRGQTQPKRWVQIMGDQVCNTSSREDWFKQGCAGSPSCCSFGAEDKVYPGFPNGGAFKQNCSFLPEILAAGIKQLHQRTDNFTRNCRVVLRSTPTIRVSYASLVKALAVCDS